ncbi:nudix (nucleoside diphosphate linked moiety X)-type motif 8, partial [Quaeritorhiza haematococci]
MLPRFLQHPVRQLLPKPIPPPALQCPKPTTPQCPALICSRTVYGRSSSSPSSSLNSTHTDTTPPSLPNIKFDESTLLLYRDRLRYFEEETADSSTSLPREHTTPSSSQSRRPLVVKRMKWKYDTSKPLRQAAVLMPLCTVDGEPSVLFTLRSSNLRKHQGEVSFPGGIKDPSDPDLLSAALRETHEEISIPATQIEVLGRHLPVPDRSTTIEVTPFVGFLGELGSPRQAGGPSRVQIEFNQDEVEEVFTMSIRELVDPSRWEWMRFRNSGIAVPAWTAPEYVGKGSGGEDNNGGGRGAGKGGHGMIIEDANRPPPGKLRIWGLTAFILHEVLANIIIADRAIYPGSK